MPRPCRTPAPPNAPARTTLARDACRRRSRADFLTRGGRPRRSLWWRAWLARLLPQSDAPAPAPLAASLHASTSILTLTFDAAIDADASTALPTQLSLTDGVDTWTATDFVDAAGAVLRLQFALPPQLPIELTAALAAGPGALLGLEGIPVAPFANLPVTLA